MTFRQINSIIKLAQFKEDTLKKIIITLSILALFIVAFASGTGGSESDPLVTVSQVESMIDTHIDSYISDKLSSLDESYVVSELIEDKLTQTGFVLNDTITVKPGTKIILNSGEVSVTGGGKLIDISDGRDIFNPYSLLPNKPYVVAENSEFYIKITSASAKINIIGDFSVSNPYETKYGSYANALHSLGLFLGTTNGYELNRSATRTEALVMLIRLLGEEDEALAYEGTHPFTDVASWATKYVAYAYNKGYTNGISATEFGANNTVRDIDYYTFVLRALKYEDNVDFTWQTSLDKALEIGLVSESDANFFRDFIVYVSYNALNLNMKGSESKLSDFLIQNSVMTAEEYNQSKLIASK